MTKAGLRGSLGGSWRSWRLSHLRFTIGGRGLPAVYVWWPGGAGDTIFPTRYRPTGRTPFCGRRSDVGHAEPGNDACLKPYSEPNGGWIDFRTGLWTGARISA